MSSNNSYTVQSGGKQRVLVNVSVGNVGQYGLMSLRSMPQAGIQETRTNPVLYSEMVNPRIQ
jgi:hypothetical protein